MSATMPRRRSAPDPAPPPAGETAALRSALQAVARVTANVAAQGARGRWTDFGELLRTQYSVTPDDAALLLDILAGRKP